MHLYTRSQTALANLPYAAMILLGMAVLARAWAWEPGGFGAAAAYLAYGIGGALWIMVFVCPYCHYYATRGCPCGYGLLAARLAPRGGRECFTAKFKRHIPVIVPLWFIPPIAGAVALWHAPAWDLAALLALFALDAFLILPLTARRHSCGDCPQRDDCPWMRPSPKANP